MCEYTQKTNRQTRDTGRETDRQDTYVVSDVVVNGQVAIDVTLHQNGHLRARLPPAKSSALPNATSDELERARGDLMSAIIGNKD